MIVGNLEIADCLLEFIEQQYKNDARIFEQVSNGLACPGKCPKVS